MLNLLWKRFVNRETISYFITGVLTTLVDWASYAWMRYAGVDYRLATGGSWIAAVLFAYVTNKFFVFRSMNLHPASVCKEFISFVVCRAVTGILTLIGMMILVDGMGIRQDFICKIVISVLSLLLNYVFSKLFIFRKRTGQGAVGDGAE